MYKVVTYASSANLGPGFDILGMCLDLKNVFEIKEAQEFLFYGFPEEFSNEDNLFVRSYKETLQAYGHPITPISIKIEDNIPISRGLGSSSSLIVGGVLSANAVMNGVLSKEEMLKIATRIEGHPDNVAPCLFGGVCASGIYGDEIFFKRYDVSEELKFVFVSPDFELSTQKARKALPETIKHKDGVKNSLHILMLLEGLRTGDEPLIRSGIVDVMHTPYRKKLIDEYEAVEKILIDAGAIGVTISGAGPTIMGIIKDLDHEKLNKELLKLNNKWTVYSLDIEQGGSYYEQISDR